MSDMDWLQQTHLPIMSKDMAKRAPTAREMERRIYCLTHGHAEADGHGTGSSWGWLVFCPRCYLTRCWDTDTGEWAEEADGTTDAYYGMLNRDVTEHPGYEHRPDLYDPA